MTRTTVRAHPRNGTRGVKRHSRSLPEKRRVPHNSNPQLKDFEKRKRELLRQQQDIIDFIEQDAKKKGEEVHTWDYVFEESRIESYRKVIELEDPHRGWEEEKRITSIIEGERIYNRSGEHDWRYKHKLTIRVNNPYITRGYRQKTKSFKNLSSYKKFYEDFSYINV